MNTSIWGIAPYIIKQGLFSVDFRIFLFYRFLQVIIFQLLFNVSIFKELFMRGKLLKMPLQLLVSGILFNFVTLFFFFSGLSYVSPTVASVIVGLGTLFLVLWGIIIDKDKMNKRELVGLLLILGGYIVILAHDVSIAFNPKGISYLLIGNIAFVSAIIINKRYITDKSIQKRYEFWSYISAMILFGLVVSYCCSEYLDIVANRHVFFSFPILFTSVGASLVAVWALNSSFRYLETSEVSTFMYLQPFFTVGIIYLATQHISFLQLVGAVIMLLGVIINLIGIRHEYTHR